MKTAASCHTKTHGNENVQKLAVTSWEEVDEELDQM